MMVPMTDQIKERAKKKIKQTEDARVFEENKD